MDPRLKEIAESIVIYVDSVFALETIQEDLKINFNASPYFNFRDALAHYVLLYSAIKNKNDNEITANYTSIKEHLFRGMKDCICYISMIFKTRLKSQIDKNQTTNFKKEIRIYIHQFKNYELDLRKNSAAGSMDDLEIFIRSLGNIIQTALKFAKENRFEHLLKKS